MTMRLLSLIGGPAVRVVLVAIGVLSLLRQGRWRGALLLLVTVGGAGLVNTGVKKVVERKRPQAATADGPSFPSGHTTGTFAFTTIATYLVWRVTRDRLLAIVVALGGIPLTGLVGLSRVSRHEHYAGDVVGGYCLGAIWLALVLRLAPRFLGTATKR